MSEPPRVGPVDATRIPRFAGPTTFARVPHIDEIPAEDLRGGIAVLGMPFEALQVVDAGDLALNPFDIEEALASIESEFAALRAQTMRVVAGR